MTTVRISDASGAKVVLVVLPTWVGDFVMATPTLRAIRERFKNARITFLMNPNLGELVRGGDWMDEVVEWPAIRTRSGSDGPRAIANDQLPITNPDERRVTPQGMRHLIRELRKRRFDWAILLPNSFRAAWIAWWSGARRRVGYSRDGRSFLLTDRIAVRNRWRSVPVDGPVACAPGSEKRVPAVVRMGDKVPVRLGPYVPMPLVEYYADLAVAIGCERPGHRLELFTTPDCDEAVESRLANGLAIDRQRPLVVFSPGAKYGAAKCWSPERFAELARRLIDTLGATVLVTCGPGEEEIARRIGAGANPPVGNRCHTLDAPRLSLGELKSLIRRCDLLVCNDAGPRHIAKAFSVPVVTVFGPTHPDWTWTEYPLERVVRVDVDCGPCQQRVCPLGDHRCMTEVNVDAVFEAAASLLKVRSPQHASA